MSNLLTVVGSVGQVPRIDFFGDSGNKIAKFFIGGEDSPTKRNSGSGSMLMRGTDLDNE